MQHFVAGTEQLLNYTSGEVRAHELLVIVVTFMANVQRTQLHVLLDRPTLLGGQLSMWKAPDCLAHSFQLGPLLWNLTHKGVLDLKARIKKFDPDVFRPGKDFVGRAHSGGRRTRSGVVDPGGVGLEARLCSATRHIEPHGFSCWYVLLLRHARIGSRYQTRSRMRHRTLLKALLNFTLPLLWRWRLFRKLLQQPS